MLAVRSRRFVHEGSALAAFALAVSLFAPSVGAQDAGAILLPPPPPEDARREPPAESPPVAPQSASAPHPSPAVTLAPQPPVRAPLPPPLAPVRSLRAARTLARMTAVINDEAEGDAQQRRSLGSALLIGGALAASTGVIPFLLPHGSLSTVSTIVISSTSFAAGSAFALMGAVMLLTRSPWEQMAQDLRDDPVSEPEPRLQAALLRWERRIESERAGQRAGAITTIGLGVLSAGVGVVTIATNGGSLGVNMAVGIPALLLGCAYVPLGVAMLGGRTASERALRSFRLSQGQRLSALVPSGARVFGVAPTLNGAVMYGVF